MFSFEQTEAFIPLKVSWCSFCTAIFPKRCLQMPKKCSVIHFHLLWLQSSRQILMSTICLVPTLLRDLWRGLHNGFHYPGRRGLPDDRPTTAKMYKWWAQIIRCVHYFLTGKKIKIFFFSCPLPRLHWVNVSTCTRFAGLHILHQRQDIIIYH